MLRSFFRFSCLESDLLETAIRNKLDEIATLSEKIKSDNIAYVPLSKKDSLNLKKHFDKKIAFYQKQDLTKWEDWPPKPIKIIQSQSKAETKKRRNYKRRWVQKRRKTEKDAKRALESGSVVILVNDTVPLGAIALLGKGLGFIPIPKLNIEESRLDMRLATNKILYHSHRKLNNPYNTSPKEHIMPPRYRRKNYTKAQPSFEPAINTITDTMASELDHGLRTAVQTHPKSNLTYDEQKGLSWLNDNISKDKISVVPADKGGAILIVYPDLLKKKTLDKLNEKGLYEKLDCDPNRDLSQELHDLLVYGKSSNLVTTQVAKEVVGISDALKLDGSGPSNRPSTLSMYKPGRPSPKIHKLPIDQIVPGADPPVRLITALQEAVTKRSDVFICDRFLRPLELDYCSDLLTDTNDTLLWLDETN